MSCREVVRSSCCWLRESSPEGTANIALKLQPVDLLAPKAIGSDGDESAASVSRVGISLDKAISFEGVHKIRNSAGSHVERQCEGGHRLAVAVLQCCKQA